MNEHVNPDTVNQASPAPEQARYIPDFTLADLMDHIDNAVGSRRYREDEIFVKFAAEFVDQDNIPDILFERIIVDGVPRNTLVFAPTEDTTKMAELEKSLAELRDTITRNAIDSMIAISAARKNAAEAGETLAKVQQELSRELVLRGEEIEALKRENRALKRNQKKTPGRKPAAKKKGR